MRLKDKVIIITGSTTGIGKAIAIRCVEEGAKVVIHGRDKEKGQEVITELGIGHAVLQIDDLSDESSCLRLVRKALDAFGKIDGIVNNAAFVAASNIHSTDAELLKKVLQINTIAPYLLIRAALPHLTQSQGRVLNIGSVNAYSGEPDLLAYSMSKGALMTMSRNLGDTLMRENGVKVNQINPGWTLTENEIKKKQRDGLPDHWYKDLPALYAPSGRILLPEEVAAAAIFWLSDESGPISGQVFELEQYPAAGRNHAKNIENIKH